MASTHCGLPSSPPPTPLRNTLLVVGWDIEGWKEVGFELAWPLAVAADNVAGVDMGRDGRDLPLV